MVIDGGSTDGTLDILRTYGNQIRWISQPDDGHAHAINKGWQHCNGQIFAWLNADDCWDTPQAAGKAVAYLQARPDVDVVYGDCDLIDECGRIVGQAYLHRWDLKHAVEFADHCIPQPAAFIRRAALEHVGMLDEQVFTKDRELWLRIGLRGKIAYTPQRLAYARNTPGISQDGKRVAPAIVDITRRFYRRSDVPAELRQVKNRAVSNAYLRGADYAYHGGKFWRLYCFYLLRAVIADPTNLRQVVRRLGRISREWRPTAQTADMIGSLGSRGVVYFPPRLKGAVKDDCRSHR